MNLYFKKSQSSVKPELIDTTSSKKVVYIRQNVVEVQRDNITFYEYDEAKLTKSEYQEYIKELKDRGYIKKETKGISIIKEELFPVFGTTIDKYMKQIEEIIQYPNFQLPKSYQQYIEGKKNNLKDIRDMESFLRYVIDGVPYKTKKDNIKQSYTIIL